MFSYGLKKEYMATKKVEVTYYRMNCNDVISNVFTKNARERIYFREENKNGTSKELYYLITGKKVYMPFIYNKDLFTKCVMNLYPIGAIISDKNDANKNGVVLYYIMESNKYVVRNGCFNNMSIHFDDAVITDYYYFISSSGKVQRDIVGRDKIVDNFRMRTNNYFETKEEANKKLLEINLETSK